jgi:hypothetical protein
MKKFFVLVFALINVGTMVAAEFKKSEPKIHSSAAQRMTLKEQSERMSAGYTLVTAVMTHYCAIKDCKMKPVYKTLDHYVFSSNFQRFRHFFAYSLEARMVAACVTTMACAQVYRYVAPTICEYDEKMSEWLRSTSSQ